MVHDPFSDATKQPKIPDGKVNDSLGLQSTSINEFRNAEDQDTLHMLLFAGSSGCLVVSNSSSESQPLVRNHYIPQFRSANRILWNQLNGTSTDVEVFGEEDIALYRTVSTGLQLKLLNAVEEDDGWFEAVRVSQPMNTDDYQLTTTNDNISTAGQATNGIVAPTNLIETLKTWDLADDATYSTGLLRDLHKCQFECHGRLDYHDMIHRRNPCRLEAEAYTYNTAPVTADFTSGHDDPMEMINSYIDPSYDMVYIRLHCRPNPSADATINGSRFHTHVVANHEYYFPTDAAENIYHTKNQTVGAGIMSIHFQGRRAQQNAATMIV